MPSEFTDNGADLDSLFKPRGASSPVADTGITVDGQDLADRYMGSTGGDRIATATEMTVDGTDLKDIFRALSYVGDIAITVQPSSGVRTVGGSITFSVTATGTPTLTYQWRKNGSNISGANSSSYTISTVALGDVGSYDCIVANGLDSVGSSAATLHISPSITSDIGGSSTLVVGDVLNLAITATGETPLSYQWKKNGSNISGATSATLTFATTSTGDSGNYTCEVTNAYGSVSSGTAAITVTIPAPVITGGNVLTGPYTLTVGDVASFTVVATGSGLSYQWKKNGVDIPGANSSTYSLGATTGPSQSGVYSVVVSNAGGSDTAGATLTVNDVAPSITGGTVTGGPYTFAVGNVASFTVTATGTNLEYIWFKNGTPTGHTGPSGPSFVCSGSGDDGTYKVVVFNGAGSVDAETTLTVI